VSLAADEVVFLQTDLPGIYSAESAAGVMPFAVNLPARESRTGPMPIEDLEKLGVSVGLTSNPIVARTEQAAAQRGFSEMESEQKLWRWVIVAALLTLLVEIWLGGRLTRVQPEAEGEQP
jgi:hypothetical protein